MDIRALLDKETPDDFACERIARYGFTDPHKALVNVRLIAGGAGDDAHRALSSILTACSASSDPDACLNNFERVSAASESREGFFGILASRPDSVKLLAPLFAGSAFLSRSLAAEPEEALAWLFAPGRLTHPREREEMTALALSVCPAGLTLEETMASLRRFKYREFLRITVRDLVGHAGLSETTLELSNLADASLEAALRAGMRELDRRHGQPQYEAPGMRLARCPFTVIAMGKLGGQELNFSSDIDIMFLYLTDKGNTTGPAHITNHQYFVKLGELVTKIIGEKTADGFVFRVDTRLRPEGQRGDLAQSLTGYETYYESWGRTWERAALIKARPAAGDMVLGHAFVDMVRPFVFRRYLDYSAIAEIREMKKRIEDAGAAKAGREIDLKLGVGGIREIEFFISALQLIYGGREPGIRERGALKALHRLALKDLVSFEEQRDLARAYEFLRLAEHRLQVVDEGQVHSVVNDPAEIRALAMRMGMRPVHGTDPGAQFMRGLTSHVERVREIYDGLLAEQAVPVQRAGEEFELLLAEDATEEDSARLLASRGFADPRQAIRNVLLLRDGSPGSPLTPRSRALFMRIMPALVEGCAAAPDPDMALNHLESFITSFGSREAIYDIISEKPETATYITRLFGSSEYFSRLLVTHPEMSDVLLLTGREGLDKAASEISSELKDLLDRAGSFAEKMDTLRRFKHAEELRVGIKDVFTDPGWRETASGLTALAGSVVSETLRISLDDLETRYGLPSGLGKGEGIAVVGFGKLGGGELGYGSDLDIIFIYGNAGQTAGGKKIGAAEFFERLSERVIFALSSLTREGFCFRVDTRLRPGGSKGVLAHGLESLKRYYEKNASVWELQALTRARAVAGDPALCSGFEELRKATLSKPLEKEYLAKEVKAMRLRMERELGKKARGGHIKYGKGGLVDIEFIVQYYQLLHGSVMPDLLTTDTLRALEMLPATRLIPAEDGAALAKSYEFLKELESKLRMTTSTPETVMPDDPAKLNVLAARMGYKGEDAGKALSGDYTEHTRRVREIYERAV